MCTVTFVPLSKGNFILTSNRDENPERVTLQPGESIHIAQNEEVVCPKDSKAGGTWIAMSPSGKLACLLNGAFIKHKHQPPYSRSRGLIVLEYFEYTTAREFMDKVDLEGVENFTLVLYDQNGLFEFRWDGLKKYILELPTNQSHIWSSCTLYDEPTAEAKKEKFNHWLAKEDAVDTAKLTHFHGLNNPDGFLLNLPMVKTVSITSVFKRNQHLKMEYFDLLNNQQATTEVSIPQ